MNFKLFFDGLAPHQFNANTDNFSLVENVVFYPYSQTNWKNTQVAIIGVPEYRGSGQTESDTTILIRKELYALQKNSQNLLITDFGNLRLGETLDDTYDRLREVCTYLLEHKLTVLIIGGTQDLDFAQFTAYQNLNQTVVMSVLDAKIDLGLPNVLPTENHLQKILLHQPNYLFELTHLGHQRYLTNSKVLDTLYQLSFEVKSIGEMRDNLPEIEPVIRNADLISIDLSVVRKSDLPNLKHNYPFGLFAEETCQICWYAGLNNKLSSIGFYNTENLDKFGSFVAAVMIWYVLEGISNRKDELNFSLHTKYIVPLANQFELIFYKSPFSEKWWLEIESNRFGMMKIPCSYSDYTKAVNGILPDCWIKTQQKV